MARIAQTPLTRRIPGRAWRIVTFVDAADEVPVRLPFKGVVIVGSLKQPKWIAFDCPCRKRHRIMISLDRRHVPHWKIANARKLTLYPSIDICDGHNRCHYFVRNGKTFWVKSLASERHG